MSQAVIQNSTLTSVELSQTNSIVTLANNPQCTVELTQNDSQVSISLSMVPFIPAPSTQLYVQNNQPSIPAGTSALWVQTGLGDGSGFTFWVEDGQ